jgi:hypothetical protein
MSVMQLLNMPHIEIMNVNWPNPEKIDDSFSAVQKAVFREVANFSLRYFTLQRTCTRTASLHAQEEYFYRFAHGSNGKCQRNVAMVLA